MALDPQSVTDLPGLMGGAAGIGGLVGAWLYVRRQLSRDKTEMASDRSEQKQLARLEAEIARLTTALEKAQGQASGFSAQRTADAQRIASLESEVGYISRERDRLMRDIKRAVRTMPPDVREVLETDFSALGDVEERIEPRR